MHGRRALVTGGGRGIGRAIAQRLTAAGASVAIGYRADAGAASAAGAFAVQGDTSDPASARAMVAEAAERLGGLDILVNNAGILVRRPLLETSADDWQRTLAVNVGGYFHVAQAAAARMAEGGCIVNISSANAHRPSAGAGAYAVSKAAVTMLTRQLALELAPRGIRVNEVCPGLIETDLNRADLARADYRAARLQRIPLNRIGTPDEIAGAVLFLCSDDARLMTGASMAVDGGVSIG
ncbi:MAG TPA: SDR family oxidoreductase [Bacillota bacterium]|nr:SDR family oxidoreductase [Bacillota bacterium]